MWSPFLGLFVPKVKVYRVDSDTGQALDLNARAPPSSVHTDIKKDKNGKMVMVRHRSKNGSVVNGNENVTFQDVKKNKSGNGGAKGKNDDAEGARAGATFTAHEDAKLKELKESGTTWKAIAEQMGRFQNELKTRWKEIEGRPGAGGDQNIGGGGKGDKGGSKDDKEGGGDFTNEENEKIKDLLASNTGFKKIAQDLSRNLDTPLKNHINKLKAESGGDDNKNKNDKKGGGDGGLTKKDKGKIMELLGSNTGYKKIADALGRPLDQALKDEIGKIKAQQGGKDGGNKKDEGGDKNKNKGGDGGGKKDGNRKDKEKSKKEDAKPNKPTSNAPTRRSEARFTMEEWTVLQEDEMFTFGELQLLSEIIMKDSGQSWLRVASRFHDKTGRRVHPDDIRDKFEQMAQMGR